VPLPSPGSQSMWIVEYFQISTDQQVKIGVIIPARMDSIRLPGKPLLSFLGLPMIEHVRRRALLMKSGVEVLVASGDEEILNIVWKNNGQAIRTVHSHVNGLSRANEALQALDWTHIIILQGDEILILPDYLDSLVDIIQRNPEGSFWNVITDLESKEELENNSIVKCTLQLNSNIQTIFRKSPLVMVEKTDLPLVKKITGLFAISRETLSAYIKQGATPLEMSESIEQLRILEMGVEITTMRIPKNFPSVNLPEDVAKILEYLVGDSNQLEIFNRIDSFN
jgi:3-deoxy-manno-octulosonate cytidylyltransferase (CMP-KDO synthetase)